MSWAEDVQRYVKEKSHTAPPLEPMKRYVRTDAQGRQERDRRDFDIVTCGAKQERTPVETANARRAKEEQQAHHVTKAMDKELGKSHHCYDIVTHAPKFGVSEEMVNTVGGNMEPRGKLSIKPKEFVNYNIVTNNLSPGRDEAPAVRKPMRERDVRKTNIVTHQYRENHEERAAADEQRRREAIESRILLGREMNPVTQQYNDAQREEVERRRKVQEAEAQKQAVRTHTYGVSGIVRRSDGHAFDIVSNNVYNPNFVLALDRSANRGLLQRASLRQKWEHQRDVEEVVRDGDIGRALGRISSERQKEELNRGYDVLTGQEFVVCDREDNKAKPHLLKREELLKKPTTMEVLDSGLKTRPAVPSTVLRQTGPRTSHERVFHVSSSAVNSGVATFEGRKKLLLPTLEKAAGVPQTGDSFACTV